MATFTTRISDFIESFTDFRNLQETTDKKIETGMPYLFSFNYDFYTPSEADKIEFQKQFIRHFYMHEIGFETIGLFKMRLRDKLDLIMPRYKEIYVAQMLLDEKLLENINIHDIENEKTNTTKENNENGISQVKNKATIENNSQGIQSDSPQTTYANNDYASGLNRERDKSDTDATINSEITKSIDDTEDFTRGAEKTSVGWTGSKSEEISKYRELVISINEQIINECEDLFMTIYNSYTNRYNDFNMLGFGEYDMFKDSIDWMR